MRCALKIITASIFLPALILLFKNHIADAAQSEISRHWAFVAPVRPQLPEVNNRSWVRNPIDRFVVARLEKEGLRPQPEADRVTLLRRLSLDLISLPPTIAEVDAFLNDKSPDAYRKQVERLLASAHYGERWGRHWLDAARYADSDGYEKDKPRRMWFYRDWVIDSLNSDMPYDQFIIEQIAGDLLPNATQSQIVATGFLRNSMINDDGSFLAAGYAPVKHRVKMRLKTDVRNITAFRLELLNDPNLPLGGPGCSIKGSCALTEFEVEAAPASDPKKTAKIKIARATADINLPEQELEPIFDDKTGRRRGAGPIQFAIDGKSDTAWSIDAGPGLRNQPRKAVFVLPSPIANEGGTVLTFYLSQGHGGWNNNDNQQNSLGRMRLSITTAPDAVADPLPAAVREILSIPREKRSPAQVQTVFGYWRATVPEFDEANRQIAELWKRHPEGSSQLVLNERDMARETHLLKRGDFLKPDGAVTPGVPAFLHSLPAGAPPNRLTFAKWLVDRRSPPTARAAVNRIWQTYFGAGLVATSEDFGKQSEAPSHPELLDWLAVEFMEGGNSTASGSERVSMRNPLATARGTVPWSLKYIHRLITNSAAYRQSSKITPELQHRDPYNRLLARGPRFRVDAEIVRDIALAASGLLNPKIGGPSVYPPAPAFLFDRPFSFGPKVWNEEKGEDRYRRAIYTFRFRSVPYPMLQVFDAPTGDFSCVRRARSNSPLQAPPDLAIEVDVTNPTVDKMAIYAGLGVPEVWRFDNYQVEFHRLAGERYKQAPASALFPFLQPAVVAEHLQIGYTQGVNTMRRAFREWVRAHKP